MLCKLALEVGSLVFGDVFLGSQTVEHGADFAEAGFSGCLSVILRRLRDCVAGCLGIVAVVQTAACSLTDTLFRRIVVCHCMLLIF